MLLTFAVRNYGCFVEEAEISLVAPSLKTVTPPVGQSWAGSTERVAAIYGANASGKTTLLEALRALSEAIRAPGSGKPYRPHADADPNESVDFRVDFVAGDVRYCYEAKFRAWGVAFEALSAYPKGKRRQLFVRRQADADADMHFGKGNSLAGPTLEALKITRPRVLFLARAHELGHIVLAPIARALVAGVGIGFLSFRDKADSKVHKRVLMEMVDAEDVQIDLVNALLTAADVGIVGVEIEAQEIPQADRDRIRRVLEAMRLGDAPLDEGDIPRLHEVIRFQHEGAGGSRFTLPMSAESSGTVTWLTTMWHALQTLRKGGVLLVDEIDASLHPELARYVVKLFLDPEMNASGAQLMFTSHDVSLLNNAPTRVLEPRNVWFAEKDSSGASTLFSLDVFDNRAGNNNERRYLAGQFGAVPDIDDTVLMEFLACERRTLAAASG